MKKKFINFIFFVLIISLITNISAVYIGIADGYVKNTEGEIVSGASVTANVKGCSGEGCSSTGISDEKGYYTVANLNTPKNGKLIITAVKGSSTGSAEGNADEYSIAHINVVVCNAPSKPLLESIEDKHATEFMFSWISGKDPKKKPTYDEFELNGEKSKQSSEIIKEVGWGNHQWKVRTCNEFCCSEFASDDFKAYNAPPSKPITNTSVLSGIAVLDWVSGIDPEKDSTYDEFQLGDKEIKKISPPVTEPGTGLIEWKVRTCDIYGKCSPWSNENTYSCEVVNHTCPTSGEIKQVVRELKKVIVEKEKKCKYESQSLEPHKVLKIVPELNRVKNKISLKIILIISIILILLALYLGYILGRKKHRRIY